MGIKGKVTSYFGEDWWGRFVRRVLGNVGAIVTEAGVTDDRMMFAKRGEVEQKIVFRHLDERVKAWMTETKMSFLKALDVRKG